MRKIKQRLTTLVVFWLTATLLEYAFLRITPHSWYLEMHDITPVKQVFELWERPKFRTFAEYKKPWQITWRDIQYCQYKWGDTVNYYNEYVTGIYNEEPKVVAWESSWNYDIPWPIVPAKCYVKNITTLELNYWVKKRWTVVTWPYYYWEKF